MCCTPTSVRLDSPDCPSGDVLGSIGTQGNEARHHPEEAGGDSEARKKLNGLLIPGHLLLKEWSVSPASAQATTAGKARTFFWQLYQAEGRSAGGGRNRNRDQPRMNRTNHSTKLRSRLRSKQVVSGK